MESQGDSAQTVYHPIRFRWGSIFRAAVRRWCMGAFILGIVMCFMLAIRPKKIPSPLRMGMTAMALMLGGRMGTNWLDRNDARTRNIRYVLGRHRFGSSDPADWPRSRFVEPPSPLALYQSETFGEAIPKLLESGEYSRAMWAARLSVALEDAWVGENWTDAVLAHPGVSDGLRAVWSNPSLWHRFMVGSN